MTATSSLAWSFPLLAPAATFDEWALDALADYRTKAPGAAEEPASAVSAIDHMVLGNSTRSVQLTRAPRSASPSCLIAPSVGGDGTNTSWRKEP
ncbi:hypothetical protein [Streptomyces anulatus]|uniref:Uncharacterized protein n=1 Tax=Streptomyces anulatus TaxID=1892 RepID=A0ABZ1ZDK1_STRAQ|nr:hypothetical protein [Streptomyces anulatus]